MSVPEVAHMLATQFQKDLTLKTAAEREKFCYVLNNALVQVQSYMTISSQDLNANQFHLVISGEMDGDGGSCLAKIMCGHSAESKDVVWEGSGIAFWFPPNHRCRVAFQDCCAILLRSVQLEKRQQQHQQKMEQFLVALYDTTMLAHQSRTGTLLDADPK